MPESGGRGLTLEEAKELHCRFWRGELTRPILGFFFRRPKHARPVRPLPAGTPLRPRYPAIDIDLTVDEVVDKYRRAACYAGANPGERVPELNLNYGTSFMHALAGGRFEHDGGTAWALPVGRPTAEVEIPRRLDRDLPVWRSFEAKTRALVSAGIEGVMLRGIAPAGPMEMLLDLVGGAQLSLDMFDTPEAVRAKADDALALWLDVFDAWYDALGRPDGMSGFSVYMPGRSTLWSEDGLALVGPSQFDPFFGPGIRAIAAELETAFLHVHSGGLDAARGLACIEELDGVELSNDPNGPPVERIVELGMHLQEAGKCLMLSNWKHPLTAEQIDFVWDRIDPTRTLMTLDVEDQDEALRLLEQADRRFGRN